MAIHSSGQTIFSLTHIEGITLGVGEEVDEVAGGASGMGVDRISKVSIIINNNKILILKLNYRPQGNHKSTRFSATG